MKEALLRTRPVVLMTALFFGLLHLFIVLLDHYYFRTVALDYAIYNFAFFDYAHFRISPCPAYIFPFPVTFIQDHFSLTLIFLSPLYWILTPVAGTYSLLIIQWAFIVWGAIATYKLIEIKSGNYLIALAAMIYYFLLFGRFAAYREDVNLAIIGSAMIPVFLYFFELKRTVPLIITFLILLVNREDYALWLFFIALFLLIIHRKDEWKRRMALILMLSACLFFVIIFKVIIPALEDDNKKYSLFDFTAVGETPFKAFLFILTHPVEAIKLLFINPTGVDYYNGIKQDFYFVYLVSGGFFLFYKPWYLIPFIPILAKKMYDDNPLRWSTETYYSIEFVSIIPVLVFLLVTQLKSHRLKYALCIIICSATCIMTVYKMLVPPPNPIIGESNKYNIVSPAFYKAEVNAAAAHEILKMIPEDAAVSASCRLLPHLAYREKVYYFRNIQDAEYIVAFKMGDYYPSSKEDFEAELKRLSNDPAWQIMVSTTEVILFKRVQPLSLYGEIAVHRPKSFISGHEK